MLNESADVEWINKVRFVVSVFKQFRIKNNTFLISLQLWVRRLMRLCALISLFSVCLNTPKTFERYPPLKYFTFICDVTVGVLFLAEMIAKISLRGFVKGENPYFKSKWCIFDSFMVLIIWVSAVLQVLEILEIVPKFSSLSILRSPRPLIMIRFLRIFLKFSMPRNRINQIFK